jgi:uncharacterized repeat protein (TIGR01451 family)
MALLRPVASCIRQIASRIVPPLQTNSRVGRARKRRRRLAAGAIAAALIAASAGTAAAQMSIPGKFQVNAAGAATYTIPIAVPPGIAGMTPSLTLEYNSQAPNGILGMGWSLGGLPAVSRCATTIAQDGARGAVTYTGTDRFCLDGQRLVAISGSYGDPDTEYRTEVDSFSRVYSRGSAGGGPAWFEVHTKSGQIMQLGNTTNSNNSQILVPGTQTVRGWLVNQVSDTAGNSFTVQYQPDAGGSGQAYPQSITYAGNTISFVYANTRPDNIVLYEAGAQQKVTMLLTNVQTNAPSGPVADYRLAYQQTPATHRSILTSVTLCDRAGSPTCLAPTNVGWNTGSDGFSFGSPQVWQTPGGGNGFGLAQGDVNGDGRGDLVAYTSALTSTVAFVMLSKGDGTFFGPSEWTAGGQYPGQVTLADVDGDGRADLVIYYLDQAGIHVWVALSNGQTFGSLQPWGSGPLPNWGDGVEDLGEGNFSVIWNFAAVDIDGDGRADLVAYLNGPNGLETYVALSTGGGQFGGAIYNAVSGNNFAGASISLADINGDGRTDLVASRLDQNGWQMFGALSNGNGTFSMPNPAGSLYAFDAIGWQSAAGDLNGDGRTDFLAYRGSASMFQILEAFSRGDGTFAFQFGAQFSGSYNGWSLNLADLNGDGRADLIAYLFNQQGMNLATLLSNGDGTFTPAGGFSNPQTGWQLFTPDIDGDGRSDILLFAFTTNPADFTVVTSRSPSQTLAATNFTTGLGATTAVTYAPLTQTQPAVYTKGSGALYPQQDTQGPLYIVSRVDAPSGISNPPSYSTTYSYAGARLDMSGRGFLGFQQTNTFDLQTGISATTMFSQAFPFIGMVTSEQKTLNSQTLNQTTNTYQFFNASGASSVSAQSITSAPYRVSLLSSVASSSDLDGTALPTVNTSYAYDTFNNPTTVTVWTTVGSNPDGYSKTTTNQYYNDTTDWYLGRLTLAQVTSTAPTPPTPPGQPTPPDMTIAMNHTGAFTQAQVGATYTITVTNSGGGPTTGEAVTIEDTVPSGLTAGAMSGTGWTCEVGIGAPNCTRSDVLAAGAAYPAITLTVNVASNAPSSVTNVVTVSGGGEVNTSNDTASDPTTITPRSFVRIYLTSGSSWTVPSNWNASHNTVEVIAAGGGAYDGANGGGGGGGGGGAYAKISNLYLNPGASVSYSVGAAGTSGSSPTAGGDTFFNGTTIFAASVAAKGGQAASTVTGGPGGSAANGVGTTKYSGGHGGSADASQFSGGGGGGAAGPSGNGTTGGSAAGGGSATSPGGGGGGGSGGGSAGANSPATTAGAGGGGGNDASSAGSGAAGAAGSTGSTDTATSGGAGASGGGGGGGGGNRSTDHGAAGSGGAGGAGTEWDGTYGAGGGGGGGGGGSNANANNSGDGGAGGLYGAGGGGSGFNIGSQTLNGGAAAQGIIVITYWP